MFKFTMGFIFGSLSMFMILDDYYKDKIIEYFEEREAKYYINEANKIINKDKK